MLLSEGVKLLYLHFTEKIRLAKAGEREVKTNKQTKYKKTLKHSQKTVPLVRLKT